MASALVLVVEERKTFPPKAWLPNKRCLCLSTLVRRGPWPSWRKRHANWIKPPTKAREPVECKKKPPPFLTPSLTHSPTESMDGRALHWLAIHLRFQSSFLSNWWRWPLFLIVVRAIFEFNDEWMDGGGARDLTRSKRKKERKKKTKQTHPSLCHHHHHPQRCRRHNAERAIQTRITCRKSLPATSTSTSPYLAHLLASVPQLHCTPPVLLSPHLTSPCTWVELNESLRARSDQLASSIIILFSRIYLVLAPKLVWTCNFHNSQPTFTITATIITVHYVILSQLQKLRSGGFYIIFCLQFHERRDLKLVTR